MKSYLLQVTFKVRARFSVSITTPPITINQMKSTIDGKKKAYIRVFFIVRPRLIRVMNIDTSGAQPSHQPPENINKEHEEKAQKLKKI